MAIERIRPIVDASGDPFYVVERDYIGAEHLNAQAAWTRNTRPVLMREHDADGLHDHFPIARAAILGSIGFYDGAGHVAIDPRSRVMGRKQASGPDDPDPDAYVGLITAQYLSQGRARITLALPLPPSINYGLISLCDGVQRTTAPFLPERVNIALVRTNTALFDFAMTRESGAPINGRFSFLLVS